MYYYTEVFHKPAPNWVLCGIACLSHYSNIQLFRFSRKAHPLFFQRYQLYSPRICTAIRAYHMIHRHRERQQRSALLTGDSLTANIQCESARFAHRVAYFSDNQSERCFLIRDNLLSETLPIAPRRISPETTASRPTRMTLVTFKPLSEKSLSSA